MITLEPKTAELIKKELESIPDKYQKPFNSTHEGYAVLLEEVRELEQEVFFGEKKVMKEITTDNFIAPYLSKSDVEKKANEMYRKRLREEAIQIAAMACRIIQELT